MHSEIENSLNESFYWYLKASKQGDSQAMLAVAYYYGHGLGTTKNEEKAFEFYQKALQFGEKEAYYHLGICYLEGKGVKQY